jgi:hypothetical protein
VGLWDKIVGNEDFEIEHRRDQRRLRKEKAERRKKPKAGKKAKPKHKGKKKGFFS